MARDFHYAARSLLKAPLASAVAMVALAFGIGVNVSAFIFADGVMMHPLPFAHLDRIQTIWESNPKIHLDRAPVASANFFDIQTESSSFEYLAACRSIEGTIQTGQTSEMVRIAQVTPAFFTVLSGKAESGRVLPAHDRGPDEPNALVVSDAFWKSRLGGTTDVIGRQLRLSSGSATITGVMPDDFDYPLGTEIWSQLVLTPAAEQQRAMHDLLPIGLLKSNASSTQAQAELTSIAAHLGARYPATNADHGFAVIPLADLGDSVTKRFGFIILASAGFVLLLACANIANLQLARAVKRRKEIAVRTALGAGRSQIARLLLAESLLLSVAGGFLGVLMADWNNFYAKQNIPAVALRIVPGLRTMHTDPTVLIFAFFVSIAAGVVCCLPAILHVCRRIVVGGFEESLGERATLPAKHSSVIIRSSLVVSELALALVLLIGAGLMAGTFDHLLNLSQGFDPKNVLTVRVSLPTVEYTESARRLAYFDRSLGAALQLPGVSSAGLASFLETSEQFAIEGRPERQAGDPLPSVVATSSRYLEALRIPLLAGRNLSTADRAQSPRVVVLSKAFAHVYWPNSSPLGHSIKLNRAGDWLTVVGVSGDVIDDWFRGEPSGRAYVPYTQVVPAEAQIVIRTAGDPMNLASEIRARLQSLDPTVPLFDLTTMQKAMAEERAGVKAAAGTMTSYAVIALLLAVTGIYAVVSYLVSMRTRDIGVYMALGATPMRVLKIMTRQTGKLILAGTACGILLSAGLTRLMSHLLFGVVQLDPPVWFVLTSILLASAFLAAYLPAIRATKIDPISALRHE